MSKYASGELKPGPKVARKIILAMPVECRPNLAAAAIRDQTPSELLELVNLSPLEQRMKEEPPDPIPSRDELGGKHRELVAYFARRIHDPAIYAMLETSRRALEA